MTSPGGPGGLRRSGRDALSTGHFTKITVFHGFLDKRLIMYYNVHIAVFFVSKRNGKQRKMFHVKHSGKERADAK